MTDRHHSRPEHESQGDPCSRCGHPAEWHRIRDRPKRKKPSGLHTPRVWVGLDGEGKTVAGKHRYTLLAAASGSFRATIGDGNTFLSSRQCIDFILNLPKRFKVAGFCLTYDWTLILKDLPDKTLYRLFRPETRQGETGPTPVYWGPYKLNLLGKGKVVIANRKTGAKTVVWDVFGFFQGSYVNALKKWSVGTQAQIDRIYAMKKQRRDFDQVPFEKIREYCLEECQLLAELMTELDEAHEAAGLKLKSWYGAGSTASVLLDKLKVETSIADPPKELSVPVRQAFFGGRFEHSVIGPVEGPIYGYDISSAYPYALTKLPCLTHGRWVFTDSASRAKKASISLIHYGFSRGPYRSCFGALPFRRKNGNIIYPLRSAGGWSWGVEFWPAARFDKHLRFKSAYIYETECNCRPFAEIARYYETRLQWGKEARGIVLKLGMNSCYGKLAQSVGSHKFRCLIWAGLVTAHCRGQILDLMTLHSKQSNILGIATDGLYTLEKVVPSRPSGHSPTAGGKPLGGWECKAYDSLFFIQPGVYFQPMSEGSATQLEEKTRSRGVPRITVAEQQQRIVDSWNKGERSIAIEGLTRFWGIKSSIKRKVIQDGKSVSFEYQRHDNYGQWVDHPHVLEYSAQPKRYQIASDGQTLIPWTLDESEGESAPYDRACPGEQAEVVKELEQILTEQPEGNFEGDD